MTIQAFRGLLLVLFFLCSAASSQAAPYAAYVMDARDGTVLHARNHDTRLHPASLTKMMTLYLVFDAIEQGKLSLDQKIPISKYAASKPPSKLGLRAGSSIELRYLIRASAVKSANDAAAALAEAVSGSEPAFARKMTATARAMGMDNTTFKNASGLTQQGHLSTARDMAILGRQLFYDFPQYYNLFSRRSTNAKIKTVRNTNRRLLDAYEGADGIKTGYTSAAGFNLVASAKRGQERVIVSMFGGSSSSARNARVAELMDLGFNRMPSRKAESRPRRIRVPDGTGGNTLIASADTSLKTSPRPRLRAGVRSGDAAAQVIASAVSRALEDQQLPQINVAKNAPVEVAAAEPLLPAAMSPRRRPKGLTVAALTPTDTVQNRAPLEAKSVRADNRGTYVVQLGGQHNRSNAERLLLTTALQEMEALEGSQRDLQPTGQPGWYRARFVGLSAQAAETACARLAAARQTPCQVLTGG
ncbi:D-alanyl-D-alanine carboxypeptidase [Oceanibium sediminis]|uniref:D-alanyl-D-alanine carboxypeptidase n=1 Tax=Oceanibium sediminis TaxID=2026339 RepID=UPI000DD425C8|nr:D-alanyl-D-alanine carboxypeptidase [Oceanibium sediminis]